MPLMMISVPAEHMLSLLLCLSTLILRGPETPGVLRLPVRGLSPAKLSRTPPFIHASILRKQTIYHGHMHNGIPES